MMSAQTWAGSKLAGLAGAAGVADMSRGGRCLVMGVVNVTPDSFSDGGRWADPDAAVARGLALLEQGADLLDVGGESTRPGAVRVPVEEERARVLPVVRKLAAAGALVSIDTTRSEVADAALSAGASLVNDVSGGDGDRSLVEVVAAAGVPYILMHSRGPSADMATRATYGDVVAEVRAELSARLDAVVAAGVRPEQVVLDPGLGFAKTAEHNWALLADLGALLDLGRPVLVAASRKAFLGQLLAGEDGSPRPAEQREDATAAVSALAAAAGAWCVRVHEVAPSLDAVRVAARWMSGAPGRQPAGRPSGRPAGVGVVTGGSPGDRVVLRGLRAYGRHGWHAAEREQGQEFVVDVTLQVDTRAAARSDELADTVDYAAVAGAVTAVVQGEPVRLLETLAERIAANCLQDPRTTGVEVTVHKPHASLGVPFDDVSVTVTRSRQ